MGRLSRFILASSVLVTAAVSFSASPAAADATVSVRNGNGSAAIDSTHMTTLQLSGSGFQSIKNGHGGIYVMFAAVEGTWRPSKGGKSGENYYSVPDSESKNNSGYVKFVAFPGSDTGDAANGGEISDDGEWSTTINVPGARFKSLDRSGTSTTIDCRERTCGVLTIGAHGVTNSNNETFTRVTVGDLTASSAADTTAPPEAATEADPATESAFASKPELTIDRTSARPGRIMAFSAVGLSPGSQVNATFADGLSAAGPLTVNSSGQVAGLIELPDDVAAGTYELRLVGRGQMPRLRFAVISPDESSVDVSDLLPKVFAASGLIALLCAVAFGVLRWRRSTHGL